MTDSARKESFTGLFACNHDLLPGRYRTQEAPVRVRPAPSQRTLRHCGSTDSGNYKGEMMALFIVLLILALIIFGVGFAVHLLWWLLIILLVIAVLGWLFGRRRA
jgi:Flp pilus assembly protein TadB